MRNNIRQLEIIIFALTGEKAMTSVVHAATLHWRGNIYSWDYNAIFSTFLYIRVAKILLHLLILLLRVRAFYLRKKL